MNDDKQCAVCRRIYAREADFLAGTTRWRLCSQGHLWFNCACGSTMLVKKGKFPWYSPEKALSPEARGVFNTLGNLKDLPRLPTIVMQVQQALSSPEVEAKDIARQLRHDPLTAAQILKAAETARNGRNPTTDRIHSLEHAIVYVGFRAMSELLMSASLAALPMPPSGFDPGRFWTESYLTGSVAEHVMRRLGLSLNPDEVFLAGSLCNLGKLAAAFCFPPIATKIARDVDAPPTLSTWRDAEKSYDFPDHSILGEIAASLWGFPVYIMRAARHHHDAPSPRRHVDTDLEELVAFANQMTHWILLRPHRMENDIVKGYQAKMGLSESDMAQMTRELSVLRDKIEGENTQARVSSSPALISE